MDASLTLIDDVAVFSFSGRLDSLGARDAQTYFDENLPAGAACAVFELSGAGYLSSAGVRIFLRAHRLLSARGGALALAGAGPYVTDVLKLTGLLATLPFFETQAEAMAACRKVLREKYAIENWDRLETARDALGTYRFVPGGDRESKVLILGGMRDVLRSDITKAMVYSRSFAETGYSLGFGGLGGSEEDYFRIMGEMATFAGAMFWLPADGRDAPDYLIPKGDAEAARLYTPFNISFSDAFNEYVMFESGEPGGSALRDLVKSLLSLSAKRRPEYRGVLAFSAWTEMGDVFGAGVKIAPVAENAPENKEMITHPDNLDDWFDRDQTPRASEASCLMCGLCADLSADLSAFPRETLDAAFAPSPAALAAKKEILLVHGAILSKTPLPERMADLDKEARGILDAADFLDMRRILGASRVRKAFIGLHYVREMDRERRDGVEETPVDMKRLRALAMARYMQTLGAAKPA